MSDAILYWETVVVERQKDPITIVTFESEASEASGGADAILASARSTSASKARAASELRTKYQSNTASYSTLASS